MRAKVATQLALNKANRAATKGERDPMKLIHLGYIVGSYSRVAAEYEHTR